MTTKQAQEAVNKAKYILIEILDNTDVKTKKDEKLIKQLDDLIVKIEMWQNK